MADHLAKLTEKVKNELDKGQAYEALCFVQSYIARKKRTLGTDIVSQLVFLGAKLLLEGNASADAGTLLSWFIGGGAGDGNKFKFAEGATDSSNYCDLERLGALYTEKLPAKDIVTMNKTIVKALSMKFGPFLCAELQDEALVERIRVVQSAWLRAYEACSEWALAFNVGVQLKDMVVTAKTVNLWADRGYKTEKPLFFARAGLKLMAEGEMEQALSFVSAAEPLMDAYTAANADTLCEDSMSLWYLTVILAELVKLDMSEEQRQRSIEILLRKFSTQIQTIDDKVLSIYSSILLVYSVVSCLSPLPSHPTSMPGSDCSPGYVPQTCISSQLLRLALPSSVPILLLTVVFPRVFSFSSLLSSRSSFP
jgi:hypothetical protein